MTIGDKLRENQPEVWYRLIVEFNLEDEFFPSKYHSTARLMMPEFYSGRVERHNGAIMQPHKRVLK